MPPEGGTAFDRTGSVANAALLSHQRLMARGAGDVVDRHGFACALLIAAADVSHPLPVALGLGGDVLARMVDRFFPTDALAILSFAGSGDPGDDAPEEPDLRRLLLDHRSRGDADEEAWFAAIVARRSLGANHLWQDLGLFGRDDLSAILRRHFAPLADRNVRDMKWKKFFYRELCRLDGVLLCKAPNCADCCDVGSCFGSEIGEPLTLLRPASER